MKRIRSVSPSSVLWLACLWLLTLVARPAEAEPWFGWGDGRTEDRFEDGDLDVEDIIDGARVGRSHTGTKSVRAGTWLTLGGIFRVVEGKPDIGALLVFSGAFDTIAQGRLHEPQPVSFADGAAPPPLPSNPPGSRARAVAAPPVVVVVPTSPPLPAPPPPERLLITPAVARHAVTSAWRSSGLGVDDARIDAMVTRARASAALPETRIRAMKVINDSSHLGVIPTDTSTYDLAGADLYLEARLTWRLDRLLYADDEPTLERTRLERQDARERVAGKVVDALFQWQRATVAARGAAEGSKEAIDASLRAAEAEAALDILTGGWFTAWVERQDPNASR